MRVIATLTLQEQHDCIAHTNLNVVIDTTVACWGQWVNTAFSSHKTLIQMAVLQLWDLELIVSDKFEISSEAGIIICHEIGLLIFVSNNRDYIAALERFFGPFSVHFTWWLIYMYSLLSYYF